MLSKFKELFGSENLLDEAFNTTLKMLKSDHKMYKASRSTLRETGTDELPFDIKKMDRRINKHLREVRRNVLTHLTIAGTQNIVPGLALVSIVIDVERIGDYTKNISELATLHPKRLIGGPFEDDIVKMEGVIKETFPQVLHVLTEQDIDEASAILKREDKMGKIADHILSSLITKQNKSFSTSSAICLAIYVRQLKRVNAHLTNIASSISNPFPRIGFRQKPKNKKK
ncbi:MAG: PhoU domain-containing protein [candidate division Zixibacteria bacterium]|nr:PhoU domain-containing protein [candidate division Zixibacteria bacterium]